MGQLGSLFCRQLRHGGMAVWWLVQPGQPRWGIAVLAAIVALALWMEFRHRIALARRRGIAAGGLLPAILHRGAGLIVRRSAGWRRFPTACS